HPNAGFHISCPESLNPSNFHVLLRSIASKGAKVRLRDLFRDSFFIFCVNNRIIVAVLTVFERIGDIIISWLPLYGEMKLALFIYMWHPKTKGGGYVYETFLRPYVARHEPDIDRSLQEVRARAWDLAISYWQNSTELGQTALFQFFHYLAAQPVNYTKSKNKVKFPFG
ncbi:hypothetical protein U1Q18_008107, partial [Sarracenia purpurea var. burkii]